MKKTITYSLPLGISYIFLYFLNTFLGLNIGLNCDYSSGLKLSSPTGALEFTTFLPFPVYVDVCGSGQGQTIYSWGVFINLIYYLLLYVVYVYFLARQKYSIKALILINTLVVLLNVLIFFFARSAF